MIALIPIYLGAGCFLIGYAEADDPMIELGVLLAIGIAWPAWLIMRLGRHCHPQERRRKRLKKKALSLREEENKLWHRLKVEEMCDQVIDGNDFEGLGLKAKHEAANRRNI